MSNTKKLIILAVVLGSFFACSACAILGLVLSRIPKTVVVVQPTSTTAIVAEVPTTALQPTDTVEQTRDIEDSHPASGLDVNMGDITATLPGDGWAKDPSSKIDSGIWFNSINGYVFTLSRTNMGAHLGAKGLLDVGTGVVNHYAACTNGTADCASSVDSFHGQIAAKVVVVPHSPTGIRLVFYSLSLSNIAYMIGVAIEVDKWNNGGYEVANQIFDSVH